MLNQGNRGILMSSMTELNITISTNLSEYKANSIAHMMNANSLLLKHLHPAVTYIYPPVRSHAYHKEDSIALKSLGCPTAPTHIVCFNHRCTRRVL